MTKPQILTAEAAKKQAADNARDIASLEAAAAAKKRASDADAKLVRLAKYQEDLLATINNSVAYKVKAGKFSATHCLLSSYPHSFEDEKSVLLRTYGKEIDTVVATLRKIGFSVTTATRSQEYTSYSYDGESGDTYYKTELVIVVSWE
jgi:hypothetical protein